MCEKCEVENVKWEAREGFMLGVSFLRASSRRGFVSFVRLRGTTRMLSTTLLLGFKNVAVILYCGC